MFVVGKVRSTLAAHKAKSFATFRLDAHTINTLFVHCRTVVAAGTTGRIRGIGDTGTQLQAIILLAGRNRARAIGRAGTR